MRPDSDAPLGARKAESRPGHGPVFASLADPNFFARVRVDDELGTVVWPHGADLDPLVLHGDFEPAARFVHR
jgi:hypothetical protein